MNRDSNSLLSRKEVVSAVINYLFIQENRSKKARLWAKKKTEKTGDERCKEVCDILNLDWERINAPDKNKTLEQELTLEESEDLGYELG